MQLQSYLLLVECVKWTIDIKCYQKLTSSIEPKKKTLHKKGKAIIYYMIKMIAAFIQTRFQKSWDTVQIVNKNNAMMWKFQISIFYSEYNIDDISNV